MTRLETNTWSGTNAPSVTFVPLPRTPTPSGARGVELNHLPLIQVMMRELRRPLLDLAHRARRVGPVAGGTVLLVTGCRRDVGCTTVATAVAASAAAELPVLLIDADLGRPNLATLASTRPSIGWDEALGARGASMEMIRHLDERQLLPFAPLRQPVAHPERLLAQPGLAEWLTRVRQEYSLIVLDGGPVTEHSADWARLADVALVVCDAGRPLADEWASAWDRLEEGGTHVLGIVETFT